MSVKDVAEKLKRREEVTIAGANTLTPKQALLDARDAEAKHPDRRLRFVNLRDPMKIEARKAEGYQILSTEEGGRRLGDELVLMGVSREVYDQKVARIEQTNRDRMKQHKTEMEKVVEGVARVLRDKHGLDIDVNRLLVQEG